MANNSESILQQNCVKWMCFKHPNLSPLFFAIPNGMWAKNIHVAVKQKREGLKAGVFDTFLMKPNKKFCGLWIEFKIGKNKMSENQKTFKDLAQDQGYGTALVYSFDEFTTTINNYINEAHRN